MKKSIITLVVLLTLLSILSGCTHMTPTASAHENPEATIVEPFEMEKVGYSSDNHFVFYREMVTDVLYVWNSQTEDGYYGLGVGGGLTVVLDPTTGLPLTYTRYMELYSNQ